jgi:hypothetical protein
MGTCKFASFVVTHAWSVYVSEFYYEKQHETIIPKLFQKTFFLEASPRYRSGKKKEDMRWLLPLSPRSYELCRARNAGADSSPPHCKKPALELLIPTWVWI